MPRRTRLIWVWDTFPCAESAWLCQSGKTGFVLVRYNRYVHVFQPSVRGLKEEAGYELEGTARLCYLGYCRGTKSTDTTFYLYAVNVTDLEPGEAEGDGSELDDAPCEWHTDPTVSRDPLVSALYVRANLRGLI